MIGDWTGKSFHELALGNLGISENQSRRSFEIFSCLEQNTNLLFTFITFYILIIICLNCTCSHYCTKNKYIRKLTYLQSSIPTRYLFTLENILLFYIKSGLTTWLLVGFRNFKLTYWATIRNGIGYQPRNLKVGNIK